MTQQQGKSKPRPLARAALLLAGALGLANAALAAVTDVASVPLSTAAPTVVKPNVMFILDDSGSMARDYMPDDANSFDSGEYGRYASQCNGLAYNPATTYTLPIDATGASYPAGTYTFLPASDLNNVRTVSSAAPSIGTGSIQVILTTGGSGSYSVGDTVTIFSNSNQSLRMIGRVTGWTGDSGSPLRRLTVNVTVATGSGTLTNPHVADGDNLPFFYTYSGGQTALGYTYNSSGVITTTTFYRECDSDVGVAPGNAVFTKVVVTPTYSTLQNYRNWNTYYRTRMQTMRSAASLAFGGIGDRFRVGFTTISKQTVSGSNFLDVADFDATQKGLFYTELFGANPSSFTPLRGALSKAGKYFAKKARRDDGTAQTFDPMQYSCQRSFSILTTDGYWNTNAETASSSANSYGPDRLDNTDVGQQDGGATPRPRKDGANSVVQQQTRTLQQRTITPQWTTATTTLESRSVAGSWQTSTSSLQRRTQALETRSSSDSGATWTGWTATGSCQWDTDFSSRRQCRYNSTWSAWANAGTCTAVYSTNTSNDTTWTGNRTECQYTAWSAFTNTASCTAQAQDLTSPHTVGTATQCISPVYGAWTPAAPCTTSATNECGYTAAVNTTTTSCTAVAQSPGPNYSVATATACTALAPLNGPWSNAASCTASSTTGCQYTPWTSWFNVASCTAAAASTGPNYTVATARVCQTLGTSIGVSDSLADVAMYYYETDLRTTALNNCASTVNGNATDVCANNVRPSGADDAPHQHMTTFTVGMGVGGLLTYRPDYLSATSGSYYDISQGSAEWPNPTASNAGGETAANIDDLWHAAVNGRGRYFSAGDPTTLAQSLASTLVSIDAEVGSGSGAAASTLQPVAGDNTLFIAKYKTLFWVGDLVARSIDPDTGAISAPIWSAAQQLQARVTAGTARDIRYFQRNAGANTGALRPFTYANLSADGLAGNFDNACSKSPALTQCATTGFATATANLGSNLVNYLRGGSSAVYRSRFAGDADIPGGILGDVIGGAPVYVRSPSFSYTENDYAGFVAAINATNSGAGRTGVVYVASNDGMLHAFDGSTGAEKWAYVPTMVMDRMYRLADADYESRHEFFVNAAPVVGDIYVPPVAPATTGTWKTILVGGLGAGGRGYYALDITDPANPVSLWEFGNNVLGGDNNLGLTFGNPVITKRIDGTWVVVFTSGYNNVSPGDGNGRLFVVNAITGARVMSIQTFTSGTTPAGTAATPNGLAKVNAWVDSEIDNTAKRFYGGDVLGNLWRFDIDNLVAPNQAALRLAYFQEGGVAQPITTQPSLAEVNYAGSRYAAVYVGTGKYIGTSDLSHTRTQTVYALKDSLTDTPLGDVRASSTVVAQTLSEASENAPRSVTNLPVDWSTGNGWRVDLLSPGERVNVDMQLLFNTLTFASNIPSADVCTIGGSSFLYQLDIGNGSIPSGASTTVAGRYLGGSLVVGISWVTLQGEGGTRGTGDTVTITVDNRGIPRIDEVPPGPAPAGSGRRTSWRELVN